MYAGKIGATFSSHQGGAANHLCMPNDPQYTLSYRNMVQDHSYVYGAEYEDTVVSGRNNYNAVCAVCYLPTKNAVIMIPAKTSCPSGWTWEYYGYLMSGASGASASMFECMDKSLETVPGSSGDDVTAGEFWHVEGTCSGLDCSSYVSGKELNCVVCSK